MSSSLLAPFLRRMIPWGLAALFAGIYGYTLSPGAFPGLSASLIAMHTGLAPFTPLSEAIWGALVRVLSELPLGLPLAQRLNLVSAFFGVASIVMLFHVMTRIPTSFAPAPLATRRHSVSTTRAIAATVASIYLGLSLPFWLVSTRAHTSTLDVFLLLAAFYALFRFRTNRKLAWAFFGCFLFSLGITCSATLYLIAPLYGVLLVVYMVQGAKMRARNVLLLACAVPLGLLPNVLQGLRFAASPSFEWQEFKHFGQVIFYMLREQYQGVKYSVPKSGWLLVAMVSLLPWFVVVIFRLGQERKIAPTSRVGGFILNSLLTVIGALVALGIGIDPWRHGSAQDPLVIPYVLIAMWYGTLASFWYSEFVLFHDGNRHNRPASWRKPLGVLLCVAMTGALVAAAIRHFPVADGRASRLSAAYVRETIDALQDKEWLVSGGELQDNLLIGASEQHQRLRILSLAYGNSGPYLSYVATLFEAPRLHGMAKVGLIPLLNEWFASDPAVIGKVAVQSQPDLWYTTGHNPMPDRVLFSALPSAKPDPSLLLKEHRIVWERMARADQPVDPKNPAAPYNFWVRNQLAKVANNLGVYLEDAGRGDLAYEAYGQARLFNTNNLSALLNLYMLSKRDAKPEAPKLEAQIRDRLKSMGGRPVIWALAANYGFVRTPEAYAQNGWAWALSGKPNIGLAEMRRAIELSGNNQSLQVAMAGIYMTQENLDEGEKGYLAVLQKNPTNIPALFGLVRTSMARRHFDETRGHLQRLRELKAPAVAIQMEEAVMATLTGDTTSALNTLIDVVKEQPEHWLAWTALALTASDAGDAKALALAQSKLQQARNLTPGVRMALAQIALKAGNRVAARLQLETALQTNPTHIKVLELLVKLDVQERQRDLAERHVQYLLTLDARNTVANYVLGSLQAFNGQYALAESSYRVALAASRTADVLNDLAWVLSQQGKHKEALPFALEATKLAEQNGSIWDTLGFIQFKLGDLAAAEKSLQKAASLQPENLGIMLRMAQVYDAKGMTKEALQLADQLMTSASKLDPDTLDELNTLMKRLRQRGPT